MWWTYALLSAFFAALTAILAKIGIRNINTDLATAIRTTVILVVAWGIVLIRGGLDALPLLNRTNWLFLCLSGVATGLSWIFYFKALQLGKVSQVAAVDKLSVAIAILLAVFFLKETLTLQSAIGATLIIGGTVLLIF
jgi:transporter family protein